MARLDSKQYAPGVVLNERDDRSHFEGHADALIAAGVIKQEWLPGAPGNQVGSVLVVFDVHGNGIIAPPRSRIAQCEGDFGFLKVINSGNLFHVHKYQPKKDRERHEAARLAACTAETWQINKELAKPQRDYLGEWKTGVVNEARRAENLAKGTACFTGFPDVALTETDRRSILAAVDNLIKAINGTTPFVKQAKQTDGNVIRLADRAHCGMRKAG